MKEIKDNDLSELSGEKCLLLLYFTASWCGPCQKIKPMLIKLAEGLDNSKIKFFMIDIDENDEIAEKFKIRGVPTFYLLHNNEELGHFTGADITKVHKLIKDNLQRVKINKINKINKTN